MGGTCFGCCGGVIIKAIQAPDPSNILWENLSMGGVQMAVRRTVSACITLVVLAITFTGIFLSKQVHEGAARSYPNGSLTAL
jgi:hypothetical protein